MRDNTRTHHLVTTLFLLLTTPRPITSRLTNSKYPNADLHEVNVDLNAAVTTPLRHSRKQHHKLLTSSEAITFNIPTEITSTSFAKPNAIHYADAFRDMHDSNSLYWPTPASGKSFISSTFGPRNQHSTQYDFHRGIDIHGLAGDPIVAVRSGIVERIATDAYGGLTVLVKHEFSDWTSVLPDHYNTKVWYTVYKHLSETLVREKQHVRGAEQIARMGSSGSAVTTHLHLEIRVGTVCSLEDGLEDLCATLGHDPHVHPLLVLDRLTAPSLVLVSDVGGGIDGRVTISCLTSQANINRFEVIIVAADRIIKKSHVLDLSLRIGFDATSKEALDSVDEMRPYLEPRSSGYDKKDWEVDLVIPEAWVGSKEVGDWYQVRVYDVWGTETVLSLGCDAEMSSR